MPFGKHRLAIAAACLLLTVPLLAEDLTIISKVSFGDSDSISTQYITAEYGRTTDGKTDSIMHFPTGKMTLVDHDKKQYYQTSLAEMSAYFDQLTSQMKGTPMEAMFGVADKVKVEKLPGKQKFLGYDCDHYALSIGDVLELDMWTAPGLAPPARYYDARKLSAAAMGPMGTLFDKMYEEMKTIKGFALQTTLFIRTPVSRMQTDTEVTAIRKGAIPSSTFVVPESYSKKKSPFAK